MPNLKLDPLHMVFCENGSIYFNRTMAVFSNEFHADELLDTLRARGSECCDCKKHTKVTYVPAPDDYDWYVCPMCPKKNPIPFKMKGVSVRCDCGMMMYAMQKA